MSDLSGVPINFSVSMEIQEVSGLDVYLPLSSASASVRRGTPASTVKHCICQTLFQPMCTSASQGSAQPM